jgi:Ulp1 family protease
MQAGVDGQPDRWPAYETVRKWTKSVDVFANMFIIVPINEE